MTVTKTKRNMTMLARKLNLCHVYFSHFYYVPSCKLLGSSNLCKLLGSSNLVNLKDVVHDLPLRAPIWCHDVVGEHLDGTGSRRLLTLGGRGIGYTLKVKHKSFSKIRPRYLREDEIPCCRCQAGRRG